MYTLPATVAIERLLATIRHNAPTAPTDTALHQSLRAWLSYYRALQTVRGGYSPVTVAYMQDQFYPFAQATLDGIAETVRCFFQLSWTLAEVSHTRLTQEFPRLCAAYQLTGETQDVYAHLCELQRRIVAHRQTSGAGDGALASRDTLQDLLTCIDQYIAGMLTLLAQNVAHLSLSP